MKTEQVKCLVLTDEDLPWGRPTAKAKKSMMEHELVIYVDSDGMATLVKCKHGKTKLGLMCEEESK
jgi:hypothetical protein